MAALRVQSSPVLTKVNEFPRELVKTWFFALRARLHADRRSIDREEGGEECRDEEWSNRDRSSSMIWLLRFYARLFNGWPTSSGLLVSRRRNAAIYGPLCPLSSLAFEKMGDARALRDSSSFDERKNSNRTNEISIERNENSLFSIKFEYNQNLIKLFDILRYSWI